MRFIHSLTNFSSGELSEKLFGRIDIEEYRSGLSHTKNALISTQGGVYKRPGSKLHDANSLLNATKIRIGSFTIQNSMTFIMEWSNTYGFRILDSELEPVHTKALNVLFPDSLDYNGYNWAVFEDKVFITHYSGTIRQRYIDMGDLNNITSWIFGDDSFTEFPMIQVPLGSNQKVRITNANTSGPYTVQAQSALFAANWVGHHIKIQGVARAKRRNRAVAGIFKVTGFTSSTSITVTMLENFVEYDGCPLANWTGVDLDDDPILVANTRYFDDLMISAWGPRFGYPKTVSTFESRLVYGGTPRQPQTIFGSWIGRPFFMFDTRFVVSNVRFVSGNTDHTFISNTYRGYDAREGVQTTDPFQFTIAGLDGSPITFIRQSRFILIGTATAQYLLNGDGAAISQTNISFRPVSTRSSYPLLCEAIDNTVFYVDATQKRVFMYLYNESNGSYIAKEVSLLYKKFTDTAKIVSMAYSREFDSLILMLSDGSAVSMAYNPETRTLGFTNWYNEENDNIVAYANIDYPSFRDIGISVIQVPSGAFWYARFNVNTIGVTLPAPIFAHIDDIDYLDKVVIQDTDDVYTNNISGMNRFSEGEELVLYGIDDSEQLIIYDFIATGDNLQIFPSNTRFKVIGKKYGFEIATMPIEAGQAYMTAQLGLKRIDQALIRTADCSKIRVGTDGYHYDEVPIDSNTCVFNIIGSPELDHIVHIKHDFPGACMINNMALRGVNNDA